MEDNNLKLDNEKIDLSCFFKVGYDRYSEKYLLETNDGLGNNRYFIISKEQYQWFDQDHSKLQELNNKCVLENNKSNIFYFSSWEMENTYEQNKIMYKYMYIDLLLNRNKDEVHSKLGVPSKVINEENVEIYEMSSYLEVSVIYKADICMNVIVKWSK